MVPKMLDLLQFLCLDGTHLSTCCNLDRKMILALELKKGYGSPSPILEIPKLFTGKGITTDLAPEYQATL